MSQTFSFNRISTNLSSTTSEVLMNAARYQARVNKSRAVSAVDGPPMTNNLVRFSLIMAHVTDTKGFPFAIPDPFAHPETVGLAWDAYIAEGPALWDSLLTAIDMPSMSAEDIQTRLRAAIEEMDTVSAHTASPFKRKREGKQRT